MSSQAGRHQRPVYVVCTVLLWRDQNILRPSWDNVQTSLITRPEQKDLHKKGGKPSTRLSALVVQILAFRVWNRGYCICDKHRANHSPPIICRLLVFAMVCGSELPGPRRSVMNSGTKFSLLSSWNSAILNKVVSLG